MTDEELKTLVAGLAIHAQKLSEAQDRTDAELKQFAQQMNEELKQLAERMNQTDEVIRKLGEKMNQTDEQMRKTDEQMKRTDEKLEKVNDLLGNIGNNQGAVAEEFFFNSLLKDKRLGSICFDDITKGAQKHRGNIQEEYDLVLTNGDSIGIVETKYKVHENDLAKLERKIKNFKLLFPNYQDYKIYGALATFHINDNAKKSVLEHGFFVLQRSGEVIHTESGAQLAVY